MRNFFFHSNRILKIFCLYLIFLINYSCDDNSLLLDPVNPNTYKFQTFKLESETSKSLREDDFNSGSSPYLYAGDISDSVKSYSLIKINPDILDQNLFCSDSSITQVNNVKLRLMTSDLDAENFQSHQMANSNINSIPDNEIIQPQNNFLVNDYIKAYFILENEILDFEENSLYIHDDENLINIESLLNSERLLPIEFFYNEAPYNVTTLYIDISDLYDDVSENFKNTICGNLSKFYILIDYSSVSDVSFVKNIEFYSTDYINIFLNPALFIDYESSSQSINKINKYSINQISSNSINNSDYIYNDDVENESFGTILSFNIPDSNFDLSNIDSSFIPDPSLSLSPLLNSSQEVYDLFDIDIELNPSYIDSISKIRFFFNDSYFTFNDLDPSNDNWSENDSSGTEGNLEYDIGEIFYDLGYDNCPNEYETGYFISKCDSSEGFIPIYNATGTENNLSLDWLDGGDLNSIWDNGEGERWYDYGGDNCQDNYELGNGTCLSENAISGNLNTVLMCNEQTNIDSLISIYGDEISSFDLDLCIDNDYDFNNDNQNRDPANDDYLCMEWNNDFTDCIESNGNKEDNSIYDLGEPFLDFGIDQIPDSLEAYSGTNYPDDNWSVNDDSGTENNGSYDFGEIFFDTGLDSLYSYQESNYNYYGKENNNNFDNGYEVFDDYGIDNIENGNEGDLIDDYIIDPNNDNEFENNGLLEFDDIGLDRCIDDYELGNGNCLSDDAILGNVNIILLCDPETDIQSLINIYGNQISDVDLSLCSNNINDFNQDNWSEENNLGTQGNITWDWIDSNADGIFTPEYDSHELTEYWDDFGIDGSVDSLETNYGNNYGFQTIENNLFELVLTDFDSIGDSIILDSMIINEDSNEDLSMWISKIVKLDENKFKLSINLMTLIDVVGLQFQLDHEYIYEIIDTTQNSSRSFYPHKYNDSNNNLFPDQDELIDNAGKYLNDYSLYPLIDFVEDSLLLSNYQGLIMNLDFKDLDLFFQNMQNSTVANDQTKLILYIDNQNNYDDLDLYFEVYDESENEFILYQGIAPYRVLNDVDSLSINVGSLIQKYLYNEIIYNPVIGNGIRIKIGDYSNNLSNIRFVKNDSIKYPRLEVFYQNEN